MEEAITIREDIQKYPLLKQSFEQLRKDVDNWVGRDIDVPVPKDEAGGYTHIAHRNNYQLLF